MKLEPLPRLAAPETKKKGPSSFTKKVLRALFGTTVIAPFLWYGGNIGCRSYMISSDEDEFHAHVEESNYKKATESLALVKENVQAMDEWWICPPLGISFGACDKDISSLEQKLTEAHPDKARVKLAASLQADTSSFSRKDVDVLLRDFNNIIASYEFLKNSEAAKQTKEQLGLSVYRLDASWALKEIELLSEQEKTQDIWKRAQMSHDSLVATIASFDVTKKNAFFVSLEKAYTSVIEKPFKQLRELSDRPDMYEELDNGKTVLQELERVFLSFKKNHTVYADICVAASANCNFGKYESIKGVVMNRFTQVVSEKLQDLRHIVGQGPEKISVPESDKGDYEKDKYGYYVNLLVERRDIILGLLDQTKIMNEDDTVMLEKISRFEKEAKESTYKVLESLLDQAKEKIGMYQKLPLLAEDETSFEKQLEAETDSIIKKSRDYERLFGAEATSRLQKVQEDFDSLRSKRIRAYLDHHLSGLENLSGEYFNRSVPFSFDDENNDFSLPSDEDELRKFFKVHMQHIETHFTLAQASLLPQEAENYQKRIKQVMDYFSPTLGAMFLKSVDQSYELMRDYGLDEYSTYKDVERYLEEAEKRISAHSLNTPAHEKLQNELQKRKQAHLDAVVNLHINQAKSLYNGILADTATDPMTDKRNAQEYLETAQKYLKKMPAAGFSGDEVAKYEKKLEAIGNLPAFQQLTQSLSEADKLYDEFLENQGSISTTDELRTYKDSYATKLREVEDEFSKLARHSESMLYKTLDTDFKKKRINTYARFCSKAMSLGEENEDDPSTRRAAIRFYSLGKSCYSELVQFGGHYKTQLEEAETLLESLTQQPPQAPQKP